ncbi:hypothetical protein ACFWWC_42100, partial [Streptomyces sp. NPDC058642]|uniref:hypothetical protein n=1 Tax=Streptomyces sp. NPDC058642 TaxID=3346572 RepID=UPI003656FDD1
GDVTGPWHTAGRRAPAHTDNTVPEFRKDAVALSRPGRRRVRRLPRVSVSPRSRFRTWLRKDQAQAAPEDRDGSVSAAEELARLRAENVRLLKVQQRWQLEREIQRRAAGSFAREVK